MNNNLMHKKNKIYTVTQLNSKVRNLLEDHFALLWVEGEISNLMQPQSGHMYFSLKDAQAQVRCAMFRRQNLDLSFQPQHGMQVMVQAQLSLYEPRGDYQLIVQHMLPAGDGILQRKFNELKKRLQQEQLFEQIHKQQPPKYPNTIGIITSPTGAALQDIISVLQRRAPHIELIIYPTQVQGDQAAEQIIAAIKLANQQNKCDTLIVTRGGGSLEDIWPFNEEMVARAIFASSIPIISGVGHEIDFTIADFVADVRAPTPSAAAELASPNNQELLATFAALHNKLNHLLTILIANYQLKLQALEKQLIHPKQRLQNHMQQLDYLEQRIIVAINNFMHHKKQQLTNLNNTLATLNPLAVLQRGFAIVTKDNNEILKNPSSVAINAKINVRLAKGNLNCTVNEKLELQKNILI